MASRARDVIDTGPRFSQADAIRLNNLFRGNDAGEMLAAVVADGLVGSAAIVSSFGAESAVLLHLVTRAAPDLPVLFLRSEEHTSELQSLMRISYAVFCLKKHITMLDTHFCE